MGQGLPRLQTGEGLHLQYIHQLRVVHDAGSMPINFGAARCFAYTYTGVRCYV